MSPDTWSESVCPTGVRVPISRRPQWPDTIVMLYAPRDEAELAVAVAVLHASWRQATTASPEASTETE
ncbi:hypothetical protein AB0395_05070 [Streptosporangium sp. NPDC051023]|uniref:luciferase domain-containing protein n=1 Tax=Streptosporangium sp. NPDC051023 TaxID=3155410 RepID=UPI00344D9CA3